MEAGPLADIKTLVAAISAVVGLAVRILQSFGERSRHEERKRELGILKTKCEIEGLRKKYQLGFPSVLLDEDAKRVRASELPWYDPEKFNETLWFRSTMALRPVLVYLVLFLALMLGLSCAGGAISTLYVLAFETTSIKDGILLSSILILDLVLAPTLLKNATRILIALRNRSVGHTG